MAYGGAMNTDMSVSMGTHAQIRDKDLLLFGSKPPMNTDMSASMASHAAWIQQAYAQIETPVCNQMIFWLAHIN